jgi:DNA-directed RNA polymerase specialized sigma24 family protein/ribosome-associated translation inhibitor RaiA
MEPVTKIAETSARLEPLEHWERRWKWIRHLLSPDLSRDASPRVMLQIHPTSSEAHIVLMLPTGTLTSRGRSSAHDPIAAIDEAADRLITEIRRHTSMLRSDFLYHRRRKRRGDLSGILPALQEQHALRDRETFRALLRPALRELIHHAQRELTIAHLDAPVQCRKVSVSMLFSCLIAHAWDRFEFRPANLSIELWLTRLLHEAIDEMTSPCAQDERPSFNDLNSPRQECHASPSPTESLNLADVVFVPHSRSSWQYGSDEEQKAWLLSNLKDFTRSQRRAFTLYVLEGWNEYEIAQILDQTAEDVLAAVELVRTGLSRKLSLADRI